MIKSLSLFFAILAIAATAPARADLIQDHLASMWQQYHLPKTLHCKIDVVFQPKQSSMMGSTRQDGAYEYWTDGEHYRILQTTTPPAGYRDWDVRWDGHLFQALNLADSMLITSKNPVRNTSFLSSNPLLRPFQFLFPNFGPNMAIYMTWAQARSPETKNHFAPAKQLLSTRPGIVEAEFPGGKYTDGQDYTYRIEYAADPDFMPSKITALSTTGVDLLTVNIQYQSHQSAAGNIFLPQLIKVQENDPSNAEIYEITNTVTLMELDQPIPPGTFTVDRRKVTVVLDDDAAAAGAGNGAFSTRPATTGSPEITYNSTATAPKLRAVPWFTTPLGLLVIALCALPIVLFIIMARGWKHMQIAIAIIGGIFVFCGVAFATLFVAVRVTEGMPSRVQTIIILVALLISGTASFSSFRATMRRPWKPKH